MHKLPVKEISQMLRDATPSQFDALKHSLSGDERKGVIEAITKAERRLSLQISEDERLESIYLFEESLLNKDSLSNEPSLFTDSKSKLNNGSDSGHAKPKSSVLIGLDEVGRGALAGPLAVGAVVLPRYPRISGLNDSKKIDAAKRKVIAEEIKEHACIWHVEYVDAEYIDKFGITASLKFAFSSAVKYIESCGIHADAILLDGNPLKIDKREINIVKGDAKCASIAAASIIAKVERDNLMCELSTSFPQYGFSSNKGYGTQSHRDAIRAHGLSKLHRRSFCGEFLQETLF